MGETRPRPVEGARERILSAALRLFAERGVAATSLREVARSAEVAPGLVVHYFGGKDGLHQAVDDHVLELFLGALDSVPLEGPAAQIVSGRDAAVTRMFEEHPEATDYLRRVVVTPEPGDRGLAGRLVTTTIEQTRMLREHGIGSNRYPVDEHGVAVLLRQIGNRLLQPSLHRMWGLAGITSEEPQVEVTLRRR